MSQLRFVIEIGMGNDLHGMDYQKAAGRAIESAMRRSTIPMFETTGLNHTNMKVVVTIGVQAPEFLNTEELARLLPRGDARVRAVKGGQNIENPETGETIVVATAAIEAFFEDQSGNWVVG